MTWLNGRQYNSTINSRANKHVLCQLATGFVGQPIIHKNKQMFYYICIIKISFTKLVFNLIAMYSNETINSRFCALNVDFSWALCNPPPLRLQWTGPMMLKLTKYCCFQSTRVRMTERLPMWEMDLPRIGRNVGKRRWNKRRNSIF